MFTGCAFSISLFILRCYVFARTGNQGLAVLDRQYHLLVLAVAASADMLSKHTRQQPGVLLGMSVSKW
jgi:hypothetical protein